LPGLAVAARRRHDTGRSGFISFVPFVGRLWRLALVLSGGTYGPDPKPAIA
jgi:uncharacterized membrane protein YhaH (DUF805 family)